MIQELLKAFVIIFIAEMGDKTQILAMAFATKFPVKKVILGIFIGSLLNHGIGIILGRYISNFIPINTIQIVAGFAFVGFSLWTLKSDDDEEDDKEEKSKFGAIITVALAFFIGELGDKTQLAAITLSIDAVSPVAILCGSVLGMIVTGGLGIIVGKKIGDKVPEFTIKIIAASVFMFFGITKLYETIPSRYLSLQNIIIFLVIITIAVIMLVRPIIKARNEGKESLLIKKSRELYNYFNQIERNINGVCLGIESCGKCQGNDCIVGCTKTIIKNSLIDEESLLKDSILEFNNETLNKDFDRNKVIESLKITLELVKKDPLNPKYKSIHKIRKNLERILFGKSIEEMKTWSEYSKTLMNIDPQIAKKIMKNLSDV